jgi:hypothetical protein
MAAMAWAELATDGPARFNIRQLTDVSFCKLQQHFRRNKQRARELRKPDRHDGTDPSDRTAAASHPAAH